MLHYQLAGPYYLQLNKVSKLVFYAQSASMVISGQN